MRRAGGDARHFQYAGVVSTPHSIADPGRSYDLLDAIPCPVYVWRRTQDGAIRLVFANSEANQETRGRIREILGVEARELYDNEPMVLGSILGTLDDGVPRQMEHEYVLKSTGEPRWFRTSYRRHGADEVVIQNEDLTDRRRAEAQIEASEARFRGLFEQGPTAMSLTRLDSSFIQVNAAFCEMLGYAEAELTSKSFLDITHPDDLDVDTARRDRLVRGEMPSFRMEKRFVHADGHVVYADLSARVMHDAEGAPQYLLAQMQDITARKNAEAAIREGRARVTELLERAPAIICTLRAPDHVYEMANAECRRLIGRDDVIGLPMAEVLPEIAERGMVAILDEVLATGEPFVGYCIPVPVRPGSGAAAVERYMNVVVQAITEVDGTRSRTFAHCVDVTDMVMAAREQERLETQLHESQKMEAIGRLAGGVAHDFNNLLSAILGYADLALLDASESGTVREEVEEIRKAAERAAQLTRQLLAFGRRQIRRPTNIALDAAVHEAGRLLGQLLGEQFELTLDTGARDTVVHMDPGELDQILVNLVVNARDAMPDGGRVTIETACREALDREGSRTTQALLSIADTGGGIDAQTMPHIFEPFFTTKGEAGTGLGLSTVYGIVDQAGGRIEVDSALGAGTCFRVYLPVASNGERPTEPGVPMPPHSPEPATVLLAEDEAGVRTLARRILERAGFRVFDARHGGDALQVWAEHADEIDILVTDLVMPEMGGRDLAARLRESRPDLPILFMSGYADDDATRRCFSDLRIAFLSKPFTTELLVSAVRDALRQRA
jgi:two-component system, cell cycle sensor histidine kinase and response regulator CckA